jgi:hypothetical protein
MGTSPHITLCENLRYPIVGDVGDHFWLRGFGKEKFFTSVLSVQEAEEKIFNRDFRMALYITHITSMLVTRSILTSYRW